MADDLTDEAVRRLADALDLPVEMLQQAADSPVEWRLEPMSVQRQAKREAR